MTAQAVAVVGLVLAALAQGLAIGAIIWRGGQILGKVTTTQEHVGETLELQRSEIEKLDAIADNHNGRISRIEGQLS